MFSVVHDCMPFEGIDSENRVTDIPNLYSNTGTLELARRSAFPIKKRC